MTIAAGMKVPQMIPGQTGSIVVTPSVDGFLDAWADWNGDGMWDEPGERIYTSEPVNSPEHTLPLIVPISAEPGYSYMRFRFTTPLPDPLEPVLQTGPQKDGEVEDYIVAILQHHQLNDVTHVGDAIPGDGECRSAGGGCPLLALIGRGECIGRSSVC